MNLKNLDEIERLVCSISNWWLKERPLLENKMPGPFARKMNELESITRGNPLRCFCLAKDIGHSFQCPARPKDTER